MSTILGRFSEYLNLQGIGEGDLPELDEAIEIYLGQGGVIKLDDSKEGEPRLIYPNVGRINKQLRRAKKKEDYIREEIKNLKRKKRKKARKYLTSAKKMFDPIYWEHEYKKRTDEEYKKVYEEVKPPIERLNDSDWRSMVKMFVREEDYRERLLEAARSEIAKNKGTIKEEMKKRDEFSEEIIQNRINKLEKKLKRYRKKRKALKKLLKVAK